MERARGEAWRLLFLINRGEVQGLRRAGRSQGKISALLHDDPPRLRALQIFFRVSCLTAACLLSPPNPIPPPPAVHLLPSLVSDLVKCSRTAAWRVLVQLINNSDNMIYGVRFAHKITVCNCLPNVFHACFFFLIYFFLDFCKEKKRGRKKRSERERRKAQGLENWVHYPANCTPQWLELTGILGCDPTAVHFHFSPFISHYGLANGGKVADRSCTTSCFFFFFLGDKRDSLHKYAAPSSFRLH